MRRDAGSTLPCFERLAHMIFAGLDVESIAACGRVSLGWRLLLSLNYNSIVAVLVLHELIRSTRWRGLLSDDWTIFSNSITYQFTNEPDHSIWNV